MNAQKMLSLWGLKWNPFSPELPNEALQVSPKIDQFAWRVEQQVQEGGFALIAGESGTGKSVALRIVAGRLAEDALPTVRQRVAGMARHRALELAAVEMHVITAPTLRLDREGDRKRLFDTARRLKPRLLLLDPLVRLHGIDENHAGEVAGLLAYFRSLQRQLDASVALVHHTRKNAAGGLAAGQGLRGSGDIHAFGDSNLYLRRTKEHLLLMSEHRAAAAAPPVWLQLVGDDTEIHLEVIGQIQQPRSLQDQVLDLLPPGVVLTRANLRKALGVKNERLGEALESLERAGRLCRTAAGWSAEGGSN